MYGLGTIINTLAILAGGVLGGLFGKLLSDSAQDTLTKICGVSTLFIAISGALEGMLRIENGVIVSGGSMMIIGCLSIGALIGELMKIEDAFERFGSWLKIKTGNAKDQGFVHAFVTASLTVCIGAMAIVGSIQDGLMGDPSTLFTKSVLDFVIVMVFASAYGKGALFSALPVGVWQGSITVLAVLLGGGIPPAAVENLGFMGSVLIFCVGVNLAFGQKFRVANMLPALLIGALMAVYLPV